MFSYVIGLEIHVQLKTASKMFCRCPNDGENKPPNTTVCPVCMGHPGTLPVANQQAIEWSIKTALALNCTIPEQSKFDRKNYFYPDLPKGYQISQYDQPIGKNGFVDIEIHEKNALRHNARIRINRLHLEEDAAKLNHASGNNSSYVDFNRSSTPLMETVTEPDFKTPQEAKFFLQELRLLVRYLDVSSGDMEKGHLRCDANISIKFNHEGEEVWTPISEIKNLNSFRAVEKALEYEGARLYREWLGGGDVRTRKNKITVGWDDDKQSTALQRGKEEAHDYRYFPEPDLPPLHMFHETVEKIRATLPELPWEKRARFMAQYALSPADTLIFVDNKEKAAFFEEAASELDALVQNGKTNTDAYKTLSGFILNKLSAALDERKETVESMRITPALLAELVSFIVAGTVNSSAALIVLQEMLETGKTPLEIIKEKNLEQITDTDKLEEACGKILAANSDAAANFKAGKQNVIMFLIGQVMKEMKGKAQPETVKKILERRLQ